MTELSTAQSYIVRIYRADPDDPCKLTGLVEAMDGSGTRIPFTDSDGLTAALHASVCCRTGRKRTKAGGKST